MLQKQNLPVALGIVTLTLVIFGIDLMTPRGVVIWVFYLVPTALCTLQQWRWLPFFLAAVQTVFIIIDFFSLQISGAVATPETIVILNRVFGVVSIFSVAALAYAVIGERNRVQRLLWLQRGQSEVAAAMRGELAVEQIGANLLQTIATALHAQVGLMYRLEKGVLLRSAAYAYLPDADSEREIPLGHGLVGEVARTGNAVVVRDLPQDYIRYGSATGSAAPKCLLIAPLTAEGRTLGVIELGFARAPVDFKDEITLVETVSESIGVAIRSALYRQHLQELLQQTQHQSEELQTQQEELRVSNEELEEQGRVLRDSQARLETQQAELEQTNVQLEEQASHLERQKFELVQAQRAMIIHAEELARANRYKSEFLANMSHELRTPLNSSLILSHILAENKTGGLSDDQVRYAKTIHASNNDLLSLINDILDLSKIEAGHVELLPEPVSMASILEPLRQTFTPLAEQKGLAFTLGAGADVPATFVTDSQRLQQILKNLLSNAFKFTAHGEVVLHVAPGAPGRVAFSVRDTGIGIPEHQQQVVFEAFRQADGTTSRQYGGTGLGLSISRELARLLGGEIRVQSAAGLGSTFTVEVALDLAALPSLEGGAVPQPMLRNEQERLGDAAVARGNSAERQPIQSFRSGTGAGVGNISAMPNTGPVSAGTVLAEAASFLRDTGNIADDRQHRQRARLILVIEDDTRFAGILYELAHELQFDCIHANNGTDAIRLALEHIPSGILLDVGLPDQSGLSVLESLKRNPLTRHIPIHMLSVDDHAQTALELGAVGYALKPVAREQLIEAVARLEDKLMAGPRRVLVVEDDATLRENIALLLRSQDIEITTAGTVAEALERVSSTSYDCMVMDLMLPDASGYDLLEKMAAGGKYSFPPVIVYTGRTLTRLEEQRLRRYSKSIIIKGAKSPERLLDEVTLFLHRVEASLPEDQRKLLAQARQRDAVFEQRRILVAEDDVRNVFALSSILEPLGAQLIITRNGREALDHLLRDGDVDLVLMDLMMPEMDGLTAIREIRKQPELARLPIIALTAKAMADDRKNCLDAGASDYISKPIDVDKLVSLCRVWMPK